MNKGTKNTLLIIAIILLIFGILWAVYMDKTQPMDANATDENELMQNADSGLDNVINDIFEEPKQDKNEVQGNEQNSENKTTNDETETNNDDAMTPKEERAINLVKEEWKKKWGTLDDVSFNVSIQNDGKYGVTVYDVTTTQSIKFYIVDVDTGIVKERQVYRYNLIKKSKYNVGINKMADKKEKKLNFEEAMKDLEKIANELEKGDLSKKV